jgi:hypothetical protein
VWGGLRSTSRPSTDAWIWGSQRTVRSACLLSSESSQAYGRGADARGRDLGSFNRGRGAEVIYLNCSLKERGPMNVQHANLLALAGKNSSGIIKFV